MQSLRTLLKVFSVRQSYLISDTISIDNLSFNNLVKAKHINLDSSLTKSQQFCTRRLKKNTQHTPVTL